MSMTTGVRRVMLASLTAGGCVCLASLAGGCDKETASTKTTTTTTTDTPSGTVKTTETREKKVETDPK